MIAPIVEFHSDRQRDEFVSGNLHTLLYYVFAYTSKYAFSLGWTMGIHSIYRTPEEDAAVEGSGIHTVWRAIDIKTVSENVLANTVKMVCDHVNSFWQYDASRPAKLVAFNEPEAKYGPHLHVQVHDLTRKLK